MKIREGGLRYREDKAIDSNLSKEVERQVAESKTTKEQVGESKDVQCEEK